MPDDLSGDLRKLEDRVNAFETKYNIAKGIAIGIAAIFGVVGAWGLSVLSSQKIIELQTEIQTIDTLVPKYDTHLKDITKQSEATISNYSTDVLGTFESNTSAAEAKLVSDSNAINAKGIQSLNDEVQHQLTALSKVSDSLFPTGAIMPFERADLTPDEPCPTGWMSYNGLDGRTLVGVDAGKKAGTLGGSESVILTESQLPKHQFHLMVQKYLASLTAGQTYVIGDILDIDKFNAADYTANGPYNPLDSNTIGANASINILPPYRAFYFCIKPTNPVQ